MASTLREVDTLVTERGQSEAGSGVRRHSISFASRSAIRSVARSAPAARPRNRAAHSTRDMLDSAAMLDKKGADLT